MVDRVFNVPDDQYFRYKGIIAYLLVVPPTYNFVLDGRRWTSEDFSDSYSLDDEIHYSYMNDGNSDLSIPEIVANLEDTISSNGDFYIGLDVPSIEATEYEDGEPFDPANDTPSRQLIVVRITVGAKLIGVIGLLTGDRTECDQFLRGMREAAERGVSEDHEVAVLTAEYATVRLRSDIILAENKKGRRKE